MKNDMIRLSHAHKQTAAKNAGFRAEQLVVMIESISRRRRRSHEKSGGTDQEAEDARKQKVAVESIDQHSGCSILRRNLAEELTELTEVIRFGWDSRLEHTDDVDARSPGQHRLHDFWIRAEGSATENGCIQGYNLLNCRWICRKRC
ncbi:hypothetical protein Y032_0001g166 [Ancylostoma ceylanicum]|uniref:Uncharacterized protein n=1 Tax=Ancylostoma ceylanicum TaxID=53326 RepID=A0A016W4J1_9BILA|nr:hypothetical protein Y032_0001g166 [Ancylostoma ceylanicum]